MKVICSIELQKYYSFDTETKEFNLIDIDMLGPGILTLDEKHNKIEVSEEDWDLIYEELHR